MATKPRKQIESSGIYMMPPRTLRENGVELIQRTRENCFGSHSEYKHRSQAERSERWDQLKESIRTKGFLRKSPIVLQLLRKNGKDKIRQGHHRLAIAIELCLDLVPVQFIYRYRNE